MTDLKQLAERYKISGPGIFKFVKKHLKKINADGQHAVQTPDGWQFDDKAVETIDRLRKFNAVVIVEENQSAEVARLKEEVDKLKTLLLAAQSELIQTQKELRTAEKKYLLAENTNVEKVSELKIEIERLKNRGLIDRLLNRH